MIKVSVIVPVWNVENYLEKCLDSLVKQTLTEIEIIVINDGSTDNSSKIIANYAKKYNNIITIEDSNHGQGYARNRGIEIAKGKYISFVDSDDYIELDMIEKMYLKIIEDSSDVVVCDIKKVTSKGEEYFNNFYYFSDVDKINFMLSHPGPTAKLYKRSLFADNKVNFLEKVYYEDLAMTPILGIYLNKVSYINEAYYYYVIRNNSTMKQLEFNPKINDIFKVMDYLEKEFSERTGEKYIEELEYLHIEHLLHSAGLRYLNYKKSKIYIYKISEIMSQKYPDWRNNIYYKSRGFKFKLICNLVFKKQVLLLKIIKKVSGK